MGVDKDVVGSGTESMSFQTHFLRYEVCTRRASKVSMLNSVDFSGVFDETLPLESDKRTKKLPVFFLTKIAELL